MTVNARWVWFRSEISVGLLLSFLYCRDISVINEIQLKPSPYGAIPRESVCDVQ